MIHKILVIGATGMLGQPVARQLLASGFSVRVLSRDPQKAQALFPPPFEVTGGAVEDPAALDLALRDCQGAHLNLHGLFDPDLERRGALALSAAAERAGLERISYLSGASVCPENAWFADTRARLQAEQAICASGVPYTIFRSDYFMETLENFARGSWLLQIGRHPHPYHWVAASDYALLVARAYQNPAAANQVLYVCGPQALTMRQALEVMQRERYPRRRIFYLPLWAAGAIARLGGRRELQSTLPFFAYCQRIKTFLSGSPDPANALLGAPSTRLEEWARGATRA